MSKGEFSNENYWFKAICFPLRVANGAKSVTVVQKVAFLKRRIWRIKTIENLGLIFSGKFSLKAPDWRHAILALFSRACI